LNKIKFTNINSNSIKNHECIMVDVDESLTFFELKDFKEKGNMNLVEILIDWKKDNRNKELILFSREGRRHAMRVAIEMGLDDTVDKYFSKPSIIIGGEPLIPTKSRVNQAII